MYLYIVVYIVFIFYFCVIKLGVFYYLINIIPSKWNSNSSLFPPRSGLIYGTGLDRIFKNYFTPNYTLR